MKKTKYLTSLLISCTLLIPLTVLAGVSNLANKAAQYAESTYQEEMIESLRQLMTFNTIAVEGLASPDNPEHQNFKFELAKQAKNLGFDYTDYGYVVVIGLGDSKQRVGMITHGDIQPFNPSKWAQSPLTLDQTSEPGKLIGRGTEDDKGPISNALYAMKSIKDLKINYLTIQITNLNEERNTNLHQHIQNQKAVFLKLNQVLQDQVQALKRVVFLVPQTAAKNVLHFLEVKR